jgi:APA family basic amino acid/polyamine antiporter
MNEDTRGRIGFWIATALVLGNMIGSGVFLLPASLAPYGGLALPAWLLAACGSILLALVFADLARAAPLSGGPYAYARLAFGEFAGFLVAWVYWLSIWCGNAALAVAFVGYLDPFVPGVVRTPASAAALAIALVWLLAAINALGVRPAGRVQVVTTALKILPLALVAVVGLLHLDAAHFAVPARPPSALGLDLFAAVALVMWAFTGLDAATIPAHHVREPERTIPRATVAGVVLAAAIYIASTIGVLGILDPTELGSTTAPFAEAARRTLGSPAALLVAAGAAVSVFGTLNGWTLVVGQLPLAAARDGLFPAAFGRLSSRGTPAFAIGLAAALTSVLIAANYTRGLVGLFTFTILLSTLGSLVPYAFSAIAGFLVGGGGRASGAAPGGRGAGLVRGLAFAYVLLAIGGAGTETIFWGFLLLLSGLPFYVWVVRGRAAGASA